MEAKKIIYSRLISKGNYENAKIEIELEVEAGEKASEVFEAAKNWVQKRIAVEKMSDYTIEKARKVMDDKRNHTLAQIEEAEKIGGDIDWAIGSLDVVEEYEELRKQCEKIRAWGQGWKDLAKKLIEQQEDVSNLLADEFYVKLETESSSCS